LRWQTPWNSKQLRRQSILRTEHPFPLWDSRGWRIVPPQPTLRSGVCSAWRTAFRKMRWVETAGAPVCPECESLDAYECRRPNGALRFRCKGCKADFSITSGTLFASHKLPLRAYLAAIAIFCNEVKGKSALAMSRDLGLAYKSAFVLVHKLREAMAEEMKGRMVGGEGKVAEVGRILAVRQMSISSI
jgi:transposase-like protein